MARSARGAEAFGDVELQTGEGHRMDGLLGNAQRGERRCCARPAGA
jgi:hypothetical protein